MAFAATAAAGQGLLLQEPTLGKTHIVFVYAGDLWSVPRAGGKATGLTVSAGLESNPRFSPDGTQIAFTGNYDGNVDVFVMPAGGGVPNRLTWHPAVDQALNWTPGGKRILFAARARRIAVRLVEQTVADRVHGQACRRVRRRERNRAAQKLLAQDRVVRIPRSRISLLAAQARCVAQHSRSLKNRLC
jgi:dipeptidyl aminopeptidase/acylaminoacyl peptidase